MNGIGIAGNNAKTLLIKPLIKEGSILNIQGDSLDFFNDDFGYYGISQNSNGYLHSQCKYSYIKTNSRNIFNAGIFGGLINNNKEQNNNLPRIYSFNYINPVLTTINNIEEDIIKNESYTMKITYKVTVTNKSAS